MKNLFVIMSSFILCFYAEYGWCDDSTQLICESSYTKTPPVLDDELYWDHSVSSVITLRFTSNVK